MTLVIRRRFKSWEKFSWYKCMLVDHFLLFDWESMATKLLNWAIACILGVSVLCSLMAVNGYESLESGMSAARHMQMVRGIKKLAEDWYTDKVKQCWKQVMLRCWSWISKIRRRWCSDVDIGSAKCEAGHARLLFLKQNVKKVMLGCCFLSKIWRRWC